MIRFGTPVADKIAFTRNISESGMYIQTNGVFKPGTIVQVQLELDGREFTLQARVLRAKRAPARLARFAGVGMGVRFVDPGPEWIEHYRGWIVKNRV
jgi:hypothetical protein